MQWIHETSEEWMEARKEVLSATDLKKLLNPYKRATKAMKETGAIPAFVALWEKKNGTEPNETTSYNEAARGHIMEPYAVETYNQYHDEMYHWDDCIIKNGVVGFSPDSMDIQQATDDVELYVKGGKLQNYSDMPTKIMEIKSYGIDHHAKDMLIEKEKQDDRWQIAVGFITIPTLECGVLCHYNPSAAHQMYLHEYSRDDLKEEIEQLEEILEMWTKTCRLMNATPIDYVSVKSEQDIYTEWSTEYYSSRLGGI